MTEPKPADIHAQLDRQVGELFDRLDDLLKNPEMVALLSDRHVNGSIALLVADGLRAYVLGDKERAMEDLSTAAEEIAQRYAQSARGDA